MRLRDALVPWVYTLAQKTHASALPFIRPMWYDHPHLLLPDSSTRPPYMGNSSDGARPTRLMCAGLRAGATYAQAQRHLQARGGARGSPPVFE